MENIVIHTESVNDLLRTNFSDKVLSHYHKVFDYSDIVAREPSRIMNAQFRLEGEDYRDEIMRIDARRRSAHDAAITSLSILNRIAEKSNVSPVVTPLDFDEYPREEIAEAMFAHTKAVLDADPHHLAHLQKMAEQVHYVELDVPESLRDSVDTPSMSL